MEYYSTNCNEIFMQSKYAFSGKNAHLYAEKCTLYDKNICIINKF